MSEEINTNVIQFAGFHLPGLQAVDCTLEAHLKIDIKNIPPDEISAPKLSIQVSGPRFIFTPSEIYAVFPPRDSFGEWDNVLPHIELTPSTLPWQRNTGIDDKNEEATPWLALILLQENEWTNSNQVVSEKIDWVNLRDQLGLLPEVTDEPSENEQKFPPVQMLRIEESFLKQIMPTANDMRWLTHVRIGHDAYGQGIERSVVVCNRMPRKGARADVHLISLENRLQSDGSIKYSNSADGKISLLSLHSWKFTCPADEQYKISDKTISRLDEPLKSKVSEKFPPGEARDMLYRGRDVFLDILSENLPELKETEKDALINTCHVHSETFKGLMDNLDLGWISSPLHSQNNKMFELGAVPVVYGIQKGGKTASWYHGPLTAKKNFNSNIENLLIDKLPVRSADQLMLYDETNNLVDASYATAWELGRLLSISDPRVSQLIAQWKTSHAREAALVEQNMWFSHIPFTDSQFVHREGGLLDQKLQEYFTELSLLRGIPFQNLIPHESLLPHESLRFFYIDRLWIECLLDGAFSIGRTTRFDALRERDTKGKINLPNQQKRSVMSGVILRSDLVSGWRSIVFEGYGNVTSSQNPLELIRYERLGQNIAIAIFGGEMKTFKLHLPPESLHFGFSRDASEDTYFKEVKNIGNGEELPTITGVSRRTTVNSGWRESAESLRIFVPERMVNNINDCLTRAEASDNGKYDKIRHSGHLAVELLEGVPRLQVTIE